jgi:methylated-DNA-[protein]-cysteine S-methyltransferase
MPEEVGAPQGRGKRISKSPRHRAIGAALGANPWSLIVPCHRIVGAGDRLTGFSAAGGVRTKARLLAIGGAQLLAE